MELYAVTYVEMDGSEIRAFGNVGSRLFQSRSDAWDEIMTDLEGTRETYPDAQTDVYRTGVRAELWDDCEGVRFVWEVQKMSSEGLGL